jgi:CarD family transcriptional regulator
VETERIETSFLAMIDSSIIKRKGSLMFQLHEKVVYPGHGVAYIARVVNKKIQNTVASFFELKFINKEMTILVPVENATSIGIRPLSSVESVSNVLKNLSRPYEPQIDGLLANWNKRNKEYLGKLRSGDLREIGEVYRDLRHMQGHKELSFGEKNLLLQTEEMLVQEIAFVKDIAPESAIQFVRSLVIQKQA